MFTASLPGISIGGLTDDILNVLNSPCPETDTIILLNGITNEAKAMTAMAVKTTFL